MQGQSGFTLVEALVALAVAAIVAATAYGTMASLSATVQVQAGARELAQTLRRTRSRAIAEGTTLDAVFDAATATWSIRAVDGTIRTRGRLPAAVRFSGLPARGRVRFGSTGTADNATVVLGTSTGTKSIVVNQRGRVRLS